jgi:hypothetical protein
LVVRVRRHDRLASVMTAMMYTTYSVHLSPNGNPCSTSPHSLQSVQGP